MRRVCCVWCDVLFAAVAATLTSGAAQAHSASDAYLTLTVENATSSGATTRTVVHGQWDIALRDLDFVLKLDEDGDGKIVWGELRRHQKEVAAYAYENIAFMGDGALCRIEPTRQAVDFHADGAYAALFFDVVCSGATKRLTLDYRLFFKIDPSHRGILVLHSADRVATALLAPANARIELGL